MTVRTHTYPFIFVFEGLFHWFAPIIASLLSATYIYRVQNPWSTKATDRKQQVAQEIETQNNVDKNEIRYYKIISFYIWMERI